MKILRFSLLIAPFLISNSVLGDEGAKPYIPSRAEWLAVTATPLCQANVTLDNLKIRVLSFTQKNYNGKITTKDNTVFIFGDLILPLTAIEAKPNIQKTLKNNYNQIGKKQMMDCKEAVQDLAKLKGWDWVKVEFEYTGNGWLNK